MKRATYEIYNKAGGWTWRLRNKEEILAYSGKMFPSSSEAWREVDRVRAMAARLAGIDAFQDIPLEEIPSMEIANADAIDWHLTFCSGNTVACSARHFDVHEDAKEMRKELLRDMIGAVKVFVMDDSDDLLTFSVGRKGPMECLGCFLKRGRKHRNLLELTDMRIDVVGIRGKSSTVHRLSEIFTRRGYNSLAKVTGNRPHLIVNGFSIPIERMGPNVTLYENIHGYQEFVPIIESYSPDERKDIAIFENQAITEYTTRMVNEVFVKPHIVVITNVRQDHLSTLGRDKIEIARAFARSIPKGTIVINCEQNAVLQDYMKEEIEKRGATVKNVVVPEEHRGLLGAETVHSLNYVLEEVGSVPIPSEELDAYIMSMQPRWMELEGGCTIFNAAEVNDVESTEMIRKQLAGKNKVLPFVYLRDERRGRSFSFVKYLNHLFEKGYIEEVFVGGRTIAPFAKNIRAPTRQFSADDDASMVLDEMEKKGMPIVLMGNTVDDFMRDMELEISRRVKMGGNKHYSPEVDTLEKVSMNIRSV
ncbi:Mur ligase family protein [Methanococcoides methylutens]|uniref:Capsular biosynthesis protein CapB n=1 Tax=Methanococcoides methylutens MM1 TaxID=1434104 RepID=A0A0E3STG8_METMT|nr:Mur ligase family protein [Methanococcoides methylutens]AKB86113.1 capsular biosynthesis protein CapB [Methanococcoides methylutens MM1]